MADDNEQTPDLKQPVGYSEAQREGSGESDGQTEQVSSGQIGTDNFEQDQRSSEGEPGRSQSDSSGWQNEAETSDVPDPGESDSRV